MLKILGEVISIRLELYTTKKLQVVGRELPPSRSPPPDEVELFLANHLEFFGGVKCWTDVFLCKKHYGANSS